jgi:RNA-binding protein YhbY
MTSQLEIQLGKKGLTQEFLDSLKKRFENKSIKNIKIRVLQNARESREDVKKYSEEIIQVLGNKYTAKIIGFSIFVQKWRKKQKH